MKKFIRFIELKDGKLIIWKTFKWNRKYLKDSHLEIVMVNIETDEIFYCYYNPLYVKY